jgi:hypothetical protein
MQQGLMMNKIHPILSFKEEPWQAPCTDYCTKGRQNAKSILDSKLIANFTNCCKAILITKIQTDSQPRQVIKVIKKAVSSPHNEVCTDYQWQSVTGQKRQFLLNKSIFIEITDVWLFTTMAFAACTTDSDDNGEVLHNHSISGFCSYRASYGIF